MAKPKGNVQKKPAKSKQVKVKFSKRFVVQKKASLCDYVMFDTQADLDSFKANFSFFGETEDNYNIIEIETQAQLDAFKKCADFTASGRDGSVISEVSGGVSVEATSGKLGSGRKLRVLE